MDSDDHIDIRGRIRAYGNRRLTIARLSAPRDWEGELRRTLKAQRLERPFWTQGSDVRLFLQSFAIFFTAAMMFLI